MVYRTDEKGIETAGGVNVNHLILECNNLLKDGGFDYAFCGGYAIELFIGKAVRKHGDIDISAYWDERDKIILNMQSLGWRVYELCGGGKVHYITDVANQIKAKRNIFCMTSDCEIVSLTPIDEPDMFIVDFDPKGQDKLTFIEFLFNNKDNDCFLYARNHDISLPLSQAILTRNGVKYLAPEMVLLYKSTDTEREGYQLDYDMAMQAMSVKQKNWFAFALEAMNPDGHKWLRNIEHSSFWTALDTLISESEIVIDRPKGTKHPRFDFVFPLDYGYLKDTSSMDGGGIDVWLGSIVGSACDAIICTVDLLKKDSEIKLLIGCTEDEKKIIMRFHNESVYMKGTMIRRNSDA